MRTGATILTLATIFAVSIELRRRWPTFGAKVRRRWIGAAILGLLARSLSDALRWEFTFTRANDLLLWMRIAGYIFLVVLFTTLRPRRLTVPAAAILLLPLLSASVFLPLELLFDPTHRVRTEVGERVVLESVQWERAGDDNRAVDYTISQRSRWVPFLERTYAVGRFYRTQCDTDAIAAWLKNAGTVILHCPAGAPDDSPVNEEIRLGDEFRPRRPAVVPSKR